MRDLQYTAQIRSFFWFCSHIKLPRFFQHTFTASIGRSSNLKVIAVAAAAAAAFVVVVVVVVVSAAAVVV